MSLATSRQTHRRSGRWSPPLWGCYEYQTSSSEHDSECETCSDSDNDSGSESGERNGGANGRGSGSDSGSGSGSDGTNEHERARQLKEKRKGKQPEGGIRRKERIREPVYRPILTIRRSEGFVWNQVSRRTQWPLPHTPPSWGVRICTKANFNYPGLVLTVVHPRSM